MAVQAPYHIDFRDIRFATLRNGMRKELGHGAFGRVYLATYLGEPVAVKSVNNINLTQMTHIGASLANYTDFKRAEAIFLREASVHFLIRHDNVVASERLELLK